jgi:hypothetical protein
MCSLICKMEENGQVNKIFVLVNNIRSGEEKASRPENEHYAVQDKICPGQESPPGPSAYKAPRKLTRLAIMSFELECLRSFKLVSQNRSYSVHNLPRSKFRFGGHRQNPFWTPLGALGSCSSKTWWWGWKRLCLESVQLFQDLLVMRLSEVNKTNLLSQGWRGHG